MAARAIVNPCAWMESFGSAAARFAGWFKRVEPRRAARDWLLGLLSDVDTRSCWQLAEQAGHASTQRSNGCWPRRRREPTPCVTTLEAWSWTSWRPRRRIHHRRHRRSEVEPCRGGRAATARRHGRADRECSGHRVPRRRHRGVLGGNQTGESHDRARRREPAPVPDFAGDGQRAQAGDSVVGGQPGHRLDEWSVGVPVRQVGLDRGQRGRSVRPTPPGSARTYCAGQTRRSIVRQATARACLSRPPHARPGRGAAGTCSPGAGYGCGRPAPAHDRRSPTAARGNPGRWLRRGGP